MLNVHDLEIRHKKYKLKLLIPYFVISVALMVVLVSMIFFLYDDSEYKIALENEKQLQNQSTVMQEVVKPIAKNDNVTVVKDENSISLEKVQLQPTAIKENIQTSPMQTEEKIEEQEKVILSPSLNFINNIKSQVAKKESSVVHEEIKKSAQQMQKKEDTLVVKVEEVKQTAVKPQKNQEEIVPLKIEEVVAITPKIDNKSSIKIERKSDDDIRDVLNRFNINHNPALSLFVAKKYYQMDEYEQAYNYALITNQINNNIEESWIIFSKSLVKMNKKDEAVEMLKKYIAHSHSSQAKQLLEEIQTGKFK
ncbi:MAG: hypothetical protein Q8N78_05250 [Sulfurimonas sp.]|nr:hypothetical protein [Sulfurimonas sp.]